MMRLSKQKQLTIIKSDYTFLFHIHGISSMLELHLCGFVHVFTKSHIGIISGNFVLCKLWM
jgi:hypothetical protein